MKPLEWTSSRRNGLEPSFGSVRIREGVGGMEGTMARQAVVISAVRQLTIQLAQHSNCLCLGLA